MLRKIKYTLIILVLVSLTVIFADQKMGTYQKIEDYETYSIIESPEQLQIIFENDFFKFEFRDERDVLVITDKRSDYVWKSGLDIPSAKSVKKALRSDDPLGFEPLEEKLNETFTAISNSLIVVEYYDDSLGIKRLPSQNADSTLEAVVGEDNHFVLNMIFEEIDLQVKAHLYFTDNGYDIYMPDHEITGSDKGLLAAILLNPFLGASGGEYALYDPETGKHGDVIKKPEIPGYVLVPDGPGALIEFNDYNESLKPYTGSVYGENLSKATYNYNLSEIYYVPFKNPTMPLYGIAHTKAESAFLGYASQGDAQMEVVVMPEENTTLYTWAYPRFVKNSVYYQIFNKRGEGYFTLIDQPETYDIEFHYHFIAESDEIKADYTGMAMAYKEYLTSKEILKEKDAIESMPIRVDFIMSDIKKSVLNYEDVVVTTAEDTLDILNDLTSSGVSSINTGLYGWQEGGLTTGKPWQANWSRKIGSEKDFQEILNQGYDISFAQDYLKFNEEQASESNKAIKHINNWYVTLTEVDDQPITDFSFAKPEVSMTWLEKQLKNLSDLSLKSHTIEGVTSHLFTEHGKDIFQEDDVIDLYQENLSQIDLKLNLKTPNQYLWAYTDRFLQSPVYSTQFLIESKTVPFLSMVLNRSMEVYAPYSNFSFSSQKDMLKMIDYNIYPSFVITKEPSYLLSSTNALDFYSTEYKQYDALIQEVYETVSNGLNPVLNANWISRQELSDTLILNTYDNGVSIYINYSTKPATYQGKTIEPLSYLIMQ